MNDEHFNIAQNNRFYDVPALARETRESAAVWRKRIFQREIQFTKCGRNVRVSRAALDAWLAARTVPAREGVAQ